MDFIRKRIGIVGGGQLGKMMILEAKRLGFYVVTLDPAEDCPSHSISDEHIAAGFDDEAAYHELAGKVDVITYEFEHIHARVLETLEQKGHIVYPSIASLKIIQDKYSQKETLHKNGVPVPRFAPVDNVNAIKALGADACLGVSRQQSAQNAIPALGAGRGTLGAHSPGSLGYPLMLKTTLGGYDGKGNALVLSEADAEDAYRLLGGGSTALMAEEFVDFEKEISIIATRGIDGNRVIYPPAENIHRNSILDITIVPARIPGEAEIKASQIAHRVMEVFEGVGTFCVEMFLAKNGEILVNEVAPRPHNSGHYTIEGCLVNQFENHIRAITGLPLGSVELVSPTVMINLLGESDGSARLKGLEEAYADPNIHVHFYGKSESKTDRKMGHLTAVDKTADAALARAKRAKELVKVVGV